MFDHVESQPDNRWDNISIAIKTSFSPFFTFHPPNLNYSSNHMLQFATFFSQEKFAYSSPNSFFGQQCLCHLDFLICTIFILFN
jgi:hypothetical protein